MSFGCAKVSAAKEQSAILQKAAVDEQQRFEVIAKALDALRQERSLLLKGKSADEAEAAVARREKKLNEALEKARKNKWREYKIIFPACREK